jgi:hypothetical protein
MFIPQTTSVVALLLAGFFATWSWDLAAAAEGQRRDRGINPQKGINPQRKQQMELQQKRRKEKMSRYTDHLDRLNAQHSQDGQRFANTSLAAPDQYLSFLSFDGAAVPMTSEERLGRGCSFLGAHCPTEATEQSLLRFLQPSDTVLEVSHEMNEIADVADVTDVIYVIQFGSMYVCNTHTCTLPSHTIKYAFRHAHKSHICTSPTTTPPPLLCTN